jgi:DNA-binding NarL/FixJ family response regulator
VLKRSVQRLVLLVNGIERPQVGWTVVQLDWALPRLLSRSAQARPRGRVRRRSHDRRAPSQTQPRQRARDLTERKREVLGLMAEGHSNRGICDKLFLSPKTVEAHVGRILQKLNLPETVEYHRRVLAVLTYLRQTAPQE